MQLLQEFRIPVPDVIYPFEGSTFLQDFGSLQLDLSASIETKHYAVSTDKYSFLSHMIRSSASSKFPNARLSRSDISPVANLIDASNGFTITVHLYWYSSLLTYSKENWFKLRDNGTIFVFQKDMKRFIVKDYPDGLLFRYVQYNIAFYCSARTRWPLVSVFRLIVTGQ